MFTVSPNLTEDSVIPITISVANKLAAINALNITLGGLGDIIVASATAFCEVDETSDPQFSDATPSTRLVGLLTVRETSVSQFFSQGVEGVDYVVTFVITLSSNEVIVSQVRVPVRKYKT